jgi:hypothetical protein
MDRSLPAFALLALFAAAAPVAAAPMEHHDLATLWFLSEQVVEAQEVAHGFELAEWNETTTYKVTRRWKGTLAVDAEIVVFDDAYSTRIEPSWDYSDPEQPRQIPAPALDGRVYLFLTAAAPRLIAEGQSTREGLWQKVPSGLRLVAEGRVWRFEQWSNPGGYRPVPQGDDPQDVLVGTFEPPPQPIDVATFEVELASARGRAEACAKVLAVSDPGLRNALLLMLLPQPRFFPAVLPIDGAGFAADGLSERLRFAIAESGEFDAYLEALGRDVRSAFQEFDASRFIDLDRVGRVEAFVAAAVDADQARHRRDAALRVLADFGPWRVEDGEGEHDWLTRLSALLSDADPWIRAAAVDAVASYLAAEGALRRDAVAALETALESETDAEVLMAAAWALQRRDQKTRLLDPLLRDERKLVVAARGAPLPVAAGASEVLLGYQATWREREQPPLLAFTAAAVGPDGAARVVEGVEAVQAMTSNGIARGFVRVRLAGPLPAGSCRVTLTVAARNRGGATAAFAEAAASPVVVFGP